MTKKRTCERCRALDDGPTYRGCGYLCSLGYSIIRNAAIPLEPCPKPLTYSQFINAPRKHPHEQISSQP